MAHDYTFQPEQAPSVPLGHAPAVNAVPVPNDLDPWQHRSEGMRCRTCMWFVRKSPDIGRCRRHAPTMHGFPVVYPADWCGDHRVDETKIGV